MGYQRVGCGPCDVIALSQSHVPSTARLSSWRPAAVASEPEHTADSPGASAPTEDPAEQARPDTDGGSTKYSPVTSADPEFTICTLAPTVASAGSAPPGGTPFAKARDAESPGATAV